MNAFSAVDEFEKQVARYAGSRYGVAVDSCSSALFLCCRYLSVGKVYLPRTYCSVPAEIIHAGGSVEWTDEEWWGEYQLDPYPIVDSAGRFRRNMHTQGQYRCQCFHWTKSLPIGKGGMILHDDPKADVWFRKARYSGRDACDQFDNPPLTVAGWNLYMQPEHASRGLTLLANLKRMPEDTRTHESYPDISDAEAFKTTDNYGLPEPHNLKSNWSHRGLVFRPVTEADGPLVCEMRNRPEVLECFFDDQPITPESHAKFVHNKPANDHVWIVSSTGHDVGIASLTIEGSQAEYGRLIVRKSEGGNGYGERIERAILHHAINTIGLFRIWCEYFEKNEGIAHIHRKVGWTMCGSHDHPRGRVCETEFTKGNYGK